jgi:hypothetical protein
MTNSAQDALDDLRLYLNLMDEIKFRLNYVKDIIHGKNPVPGTIGKDICYLQLRMVCELIALGSLVAHRDIKASTRSLSDKYQADFLIKRMARVHPNFYPKPAHYPAAGIPLKAGEMRSEPKLLTSGFLTAKDLHSLYHECGRELHRGNLNDLLERHGKKVEIAYSPIGKWVDKIVYLLRFHRIQLLGGNEFWVEMESQHAGGRAFASTMSAPFILSGP